MSTLRERIGAIVSDMEAVNQASCMVERELYENDYHDAHKAWQMRRIRLERYVKEIKSALDSTQE